MSLDKLFVLVGFFAFLMSIGGLTIFFSSAYAQKKWNPNYKNNSEADE